MILKVDNKDEFVSSFLSPLNKISNSCVLKITENGVSVLLSGADNTVVLYGQYKKPIDISSPTTLNIPDLGRLIKILQCIDEDSISLEINTNHIKYVSDNIRFKYHLLEDGIIADPPVSVDKIKKIEYNTAFIIPYSSLISLIKSSTFTINLNKVYIMTKGTNVYAEVNDRQAQNVDSICIKLCDKFNGTPITTPLPVSFDTIRTLAGSRGVNIKALINTELNVMTFEINNNDVKMTYIISGLVK